jgi:hypothetical protein
MKTAFLGILQYSPGHRETHLQSPGDHDDPPIAPLFSKTFQEPIGHGAAIGDSQGMLNLLAPHFDQGKMSPPMISTKTLGNSFNTGWILSRMYGLPKMSHKAFYAEVD